MKIVNADDLKKELSKAPVWTAIAVKEMIDEMTKTLVQCKECRYWKWIEWAKESRCTLRNTAFNARADDYCSYGEREGE